MALADKIPQRPGGLFQSGCSRQRLHRDRPERGEQVVGAVGEALVAVFFRSGQAWLPGLPEPIFPEAAEAFLVQHPVVFVEDEGHARQ